MTDKLTRLLDIIDADWIEENPATAYELIQGLVSDIRHYKDAIEVQNESLMLAKALLEQMKK